MRSKSDLYDAAEIPFFSQKFTRDAIDILSEEDELTIYCGAGLTIDRTGLDWSALVHAVLTDRTKIPKVDISDDDAREIIEALEPLYAATVASHYMKENAGDGFASRGALMTSLQTHLYPLSDWNSGDLVTNVARLVVARARAGRSTKLVTTNYDTFLENAFRDILEGDERLNHALPTPPVSVQIPSEEKKKRRRFLLPGRGDCAKCGEIELIYLHGRIPRAGGLRGKVVFTERDYLDVQKTVAKSLRRLFKLKPLLVIGASLRDRPLLDALLKTRSLKREDGKRPPRYALLALESFSGKAQLTIGKSISLTNLLPARMEEFGVELLMPDFFSQVPQFVEEMRAALMSEEAGYIPFATRLSSWRQEWEKSGREWDHLLSCHSLLGKSLASIVEELGSTRRRNRFDPEEHFKLELWVRIPSGNGSRTLELWASSNGIAKDQTYLRRARISVASAYSPIKAMKLGAPNRMSENRVIDGHLRSPEEMRWKTFLSVPVAIEYMGGRLTVGVVMLASTASDQRSRIRSSRPGRMKEAVDIMRKIGKRYLTPSGR